MKTDFKLSSIDFKKTIINCFFILVLGTLFFYIMIQFHIFRIIALVDKIFVGLIFIILFSTLGIRQKTDAKKHRK
jgi:hypothetical protein